LFAISAAFVVSFFKMRSFNTSWLGRSNPYFFDICTKPVFEKWQRAGAMAEEIATKLKDETNEEVLLVSHSAGTHIALLVFAELLRSEPKLVKEAIREKRLLFMTLGSLIPVLSHACKPVQTALRETCESGVSWLDVTGPSDPACCVLMDPCQDLFGGEPRVHVVNAKLYKIFSKETFSKAKKNRFYMHFLYLKEPDDLKNSEKGFSFYRLLASREKITSNYGKPIKEVKPFYV